MALIPPFFLDCVVGIGIINNSKKQWIGTGFLYGNYIEKNTEGQNLYEVFLVTNKHVINDLSKIILRFNPQEDSPAKDYELSLNDQNRFGHPNPKIDVAIIPINTNLLKSEGMKFQFFNSDIHTFNKKQLIDNETTEGDGVFVLGFPMGLIGTDRQHVILRNGCIARIRDLFENRNTDFIVDALVFPGNSGGPVILKPEIINIEGTKVNNKAALIGIIKSYIPYQDTAVSLQTKRPRIIFEDNTGLSLVEPVDHIFETIEHYKKLKMIPTNINNNQQFQYILKK
ncbi:serine protease [Epilithonimonas vandammei]|uniref:Serine protease n=1 Tax=Epilithonimonas vandammei TaxID=2487072 RepID=A0A3G8ZEJ7_9FLAO|nr:serine protease [Epilithonimonas vandammei]AZI55623.1 serine protease [Epilithonimonas vandammei]